jgi:hypothetical protein
MPEKTLVAFSGHRSSKVEKKAENKYVPLERTVATNPPPSLGGFDIDRISR